MARVPVEIEEADIENDRGNDQPGVRARCTRCDHETESFGTEEPSVRRCLALLAEECPRRESNFYVDAAEARQYPLDENPDMIEALVYHTVGQKETPRSGVRKDHVEAAVQARGASGAAVATAIRRLIAARELIEDFDGLRRRPGVHEARYLALVGEHFAAAAAATEANWHDGELDR